MARKLFCKLNHERGEKFSVAGQLHTIGADGYVEVDDEHAPLLLQNDGKWADPSLATAPYKRPNGPPALILADAQGRVLSRGGSRQGRWGRGRGRSLPRPRRNRRWIPSLLRRSGPRRARTRRSTICSPTSRSSRSRATCSPATS